MDEVLRDFEAMLGRRRLSPNTISCYLSDVREFFEDTPKSIDDLNRMTAEALQKHFDRRRYSTRTALRKISTLGMFSKHLKRKGVESPLSLEHFDSLKVKLNIGPVEDERNYFSPDDLKRFIEEVRKADTNPYRIARDILLPVMFYNAGLRTQEVRNLRDSSLQIDARKKLASLEISSGSERSRTVEFDISPGAKEIISYPVRLRDFKEEVESTSDNLVLNKHGGPLSGRSTRKNFEDYALDCGMSAITPRSLRYSHVINLLRQGKGMGEIESRLGLIAPLPPFYLADAEKLKVA